MSLSTEDRVAFIQMMPDLGPDCERSRLLHFLQTRKVEAIEELRSLPGFEQVRAGLLRVLPELLPEKQAREEMLRKVGPVIATAVEPSAKGPDGVFSRHPAWVGLSILEYCEQAERADGGLDWAVELAARAFLVQGGAHGVGRGEVLWAMAEQAEDVGWLERTSTLLNEAIQGPFAESHHRDQVAILLAMRKLDSGPGDGEELLDSILESSDADYQTFVHAVWIKAHLLKERGELEGAVVWVEKGLDALQGQGDEAENRLRNLLLEMRE